MIYSKNKDITTLIMANHGHYMYSKVNASESAVMCH